MTAADELHGGCLCRQIRYVALGQPVAVSLCHCENCRRNTGSAYSVNAIFPEAAVTVSGELAVFEDRGDSGHPVQRYFCSRCGTPIRSAAHATRGLFALKAGTLDEPERITPTSEVYCDREVTGWRGAFQRFALLPG
jgi:hypothetical protein